MTILVFVLVAFLIFEIGFNWNLFKQKLRAETSAQRWCIASVEEHKKNEEKDAEIIRLNEKLKETDEELSNENRILRYRIAECRYITALLEQHGIEWESGWRRAREKSMSEDE